MTRPPAAATPAPAPLFVSYAREDQARVERLVAVFEAQGIETFWDREMPIGIEWPQFLEQQLAGARCVVVLWTKHSVDSRWVRIEAYEAMQKAKLVPVLLEPVEQPLAFRDLQTADLLGWDGDTRDPRLALLVQTVRRRLGLAAIGESARTAADRASEGPAHRPTVTAFPVTHEAGASSGAASATLSHTTSGATSETTHVGVDGARSTSGTGGTGGTDGTDSTADHDTHDDTRRRRWLAGLSALAVLVVLALLIANQMRTPAPGPEAGPGSVPTTTARPSSDQPASAPDGAGSLSRTTTTPSRTQPSAASPSAAVPSTSAPAASAPSGLTPPRPDTIRLPTTPSSALPRPADTVASLPVSAPRPTTTTAPADTVRPRPSTLPPRCQSIVERQALNEPISPDDLRFLRQECRR